MCACLCERVCMHVSVHLCVHLCVHVCACVYVHACVRVDILQYIGRICTQAQVNSVHNNVNTQGAITTRLRSVRPFHDSTDQGDLLLVIRLRRRPDMTCHDRTSNDATEQRLIDRFLDVIRFLLPVPSSGSFFRFLDLTRVGFLYRSDKFLLCAADCSKRNPTSSEEFNDGRANTRTNILNSLFRFPSLIF